MRLSPDSIRVRRRCGDENSIERLWCQSLASRIVGPQSLSKACKQNEQVSAESRQFLYLTTTGRKTGKPHKIEIWFVARDGKYYLVSENGGRSHWVQNLKDDPKISFSVGKDAYRGEGRVISRKKEPELAAKVTALMNAKYKWSEGLIVELAPGRS